MVNPKINVWYMACINELVRFFGEVQYDDFTFKWVMIPDFYLPETFRHEVSSLLIETPGMNISNPEGYHFYMDLDLSRFDRQQRVRLFEQTEMNPYADKGYQYLCFYLADFNPRFPAQAGDTLLTICQTLYHFLEEGW